MICDTILLLNNPNVYISDKELVYVSFLQLLPEKLGLRVFIIIYATLCLLATPSGSLAGSTKVIYVNRSVAEGSGSGDSWNDACQDLQVAMQKANDNPDTQYEIWVAAGTYKPTSGDQRDKSFELNKNIALYGGFKGNESERNQRDFKRELREQRG